MACINGSGVDLENLENGKYDINEWGEFSDESLTCLMVAARNGRERMVKFLLEQPGIQINVVNDDGRTALHQASRQGEAEVTRMLLAALGQESLHVKDKEGMTPLMAAVTANQVN